MLFFKPTPEAARRAALREAELDLLTYEKHHDYYRTAVETTKSRVLRLQRQVQEDEAAAAARAQAARESFGC